MPPSHCIIVVGLDDQNRRVIEACLMEDRFKIVVVDSEPENASQQNADLVIFAGPDDCHRTQEQCASLRRQFGQHAPLLACVGRYVFPAISPLLESDLQGIIMTPLDASEFRRTLDQLELGF